MTLLVALTGLALSSCAEPPVGRVDSPQVQASGQALAAQAQAAVQSDDEPGDLTAEEVRRPPKQVSAGVWRSSRLDEPGLARLFDLGVATILDLESASLNREEVE